MCVMSLFLLMMFTLLLLLIAAAVLDAAGCCALLLLLHVATCAAARWGYSILHDPPLHVHIKNCFNMCLSRVSRTAHTYWITQCHENAARH
jgi:hypothetical protein